MSTVIKSNQIFSGDGATIDQVLTNPDAVYNAFVSRVSADGGSIVSETKVRNAIDFIFENNLFGRLGVCASPHYAKKLDANGGVLKLYSITGVDLVGLALNAGALPKITSDNFVNFNEGMSSDTDGGILTTETKRAWSDTGRFAFAIATKENVNSGATPIASLTTHGETSLNSDTFSVLTYTASSGTGQGRINDASYGGSTRTLTAITINNPKNGALIFMYNKPMLSAKLMVHGITQGTLTALTVPEQVYKNDHYVDFGGVSRATTKAVSGVKMSAMWFMTDLSESQAIKINQFHEAEYL